mmetsp:Transcript_48765/g.106561  ORF Transcript_48765/g.106561 Transcript_48765/m.106561 type:complete len:264 (+) Transcript_48765:85-876(+)
MERFNGHVAVVQRSCTRCDPLLHLRFPLDGGEVCGIGAEHLQPMGPGYIVLRHDSETQQERLFCALCGVWAGAQHVSSRPHHFRARCSWKFLQEEDRPQRSQRKALTRDSSGAARRRCPAPPPSPPPPDTEVDRSGPAPPIPRPIGRGHAVPPPPPPAKPDAFAGTCGSPRGLIWAWALNSEGSSPLCPVELESLDPDTWRPELFRRYAWHRGPMDHASKPAVPSPVRGAGAPAAASAEAPARPSCSLEAWLAGGSRVVVSAG